ADVRSEMTAEPLEPGGNLLDLRLVRLLAADEIRAVAAVVLAASDIAGAHLLHSPGSCADQRRLAARGKLARQPHPRIGLGIGVDVHQDGCVPHPLLPPPGAKVLASAYPSHHATPVVHGQGAPGASMGVLGSTSPWLVIIPVRPVPLATRSDPS